MMEQDQLIPAHISYLAVAFADPNGVQREAHVTHQQAAFANSAVRYDDWATFKNVVDKAFEVARALHQEYTQARDPEQTAAIEENTALLRVERDIIELVEQIQEARRNGILTVAGLLNAEVAKRLQYARLRGEDTVSNPAQAARRAIQLEMHLLEREIDQRKVMAGAFTEPPIALLEQHLRELRTLMRDA